MGEEFVIWVYWEIYLGEGISDPSFIKIQSLPRIRQPELSRLKGGDLSHYSVERLLSFLNHLNQRVEIKIIPSTKRKAAETVLELQRVPKLKSPLDVKGIDVPGINRSDILKSIKDGRRRR